MADDKKRVNPFVKGIPKLDPTELKKAFDDGLAEGRAEGRMEILNWLEDKYINDPGRPDRNSPEGQALLNLAAEAADHIRNTK